MNPARGALGPIATVVALSMLGCAAPAVATLPAPTALDWIRVRERLGGSRALEPKRPYVEQIIVAMREPVTRKTFQARGALAIDPHRALRMILIGPGGGTALDVWVTDERWRFVVPALSIRKSGGADPASWRGLPIGFFRWWMLHPLDGRLLAAWLKQGDPVYLLRRGDDTVILRDHWGEGEHHVFALRREHGAVEELEWVGRAPTPHAGDKARYVHAPSGLEVEVLVESVSDDEPDAAAFLDPDAEGTAL